MPDGDDKQNITQEELNQERELLEIREQVREEADKYLSKADKIAEMRKKEMEYLEQRAEYHEQEYQKLEELMATRGDTIDKIQKINEEMEKANVAQSKASKEEFEKKDKLGNKLVELSEKKKEHIEDLTQQSDISEEEIKRMLRKDETLEEMLEKQRNLADSARQALTHRQSASEIAENTIETFTGVSESWKDTALGRFISGAATGGETWTQTLEGFTQKAEQMLTPANILGSSLMKVQEATLNWAVAQEQAEAQVAQATGTGREYSETMRNVAFESYQFAVSQEEVGQAMTSLHDEFGAFMHLNDKAQESVTKTITKLDKLGVSTNESASMINLLSKSFNMGAEQAAHMTAELTLFGKEIGKGSKIVAEFNKAMPELMQHGREAIDVFKGLAQQSEQLGIKTQKLTNVAKKYNTFQDAAKHAGRLNAMLGGNMVNSIDLLMAKEDERIEMLRRSVKQSGQAWQAMGRFQKQAIASAAGIEDMAMASKLFGGSVQEYERAASKMEEMRKVQERLNEQSKRSASLMKQLKLLVGTFVIPTGKLVDVLSSVVDWLAWVDKGLREYTDGWASVANIMIGAVAVAKLFGTSIIGTLIGGLKKAIFWVGSTATSMVGLTKAENGATKASAKLGKAMGGLGASILAIGAGVGIAAAGIGYLASSMSQLDPEKWRMFKNTLYGIAAGLAVMTIAVVAAATALAPSVPVLVGLGAALMMIGAGVGMAAAGFGVLFSAIGGTKRIMAMTKMFAVMATSLSTIAVVSGIAGAGITAFSAAVTGLAGALALLPEEKMVKFSTMMNSTSDMLEQANSASPKQVQVVKEIVKQSKEYHKMIAESEAKGNEDLLQKLLAKVENVLNAGGAGGGGGGKAAAGSGKIVVPLEIGGRQFKKFIIDTVNEEVDVKNDMF